MGFVKFREILRQLVSIAEPFAHQPVGASQPCEAPNAKKRQAAVARGLDDTGYPVFAGDVAGVIAEGLQPHVVLAAKANSSFIDQSAGKRVGPTESGSLSPKGFFAIAKATAVGNSFKGSRSELRSIGKTITPKDLVVGSKVVINAHVNRVRIIHIRSIDRVISEESRCRRTRIQTEQFHGVRAQTVGGNPIPWEGVPYRAGSRGGQTCHVIDLRRGNRPSRGRSDKCSQG